MIQVKTVACYVDFTSLAGDVLAAGAAVARSFGARLLAAAVLPIPGVRAAGYLLPDSSSVGDVDYAQAAQQLEELVRTTPHAGVSVESCPISGNAAEALISLVKREGAALLLVGSPASRPLLAPLDRLQEKLYRSASCPVLVINSAAVARGYNRGLDWAAAPRRILVATGLEPPSESAVLAAILLARQYSAELTVLHVAEKRKDALTQGFQFWQFLAGFAPASQSLLSTSICPEWLNPQPRMLIVEGRRDSGIIETAGRLAADILIVGARRPPLGVALWPSLASRLASAAPCPLLVAGPNALGNIVGGLQRPKPKSFAAAS